MEDLIAYFENTDSKVVLIIENENGKLEVLSINVDDYHNLDTLMTRGFEKLTQR